MSTPQPVVRVVIEFSAGSSPISGTVIVEPEGASHAFVGWTDLAIAFESVVSSIPPRSGTAIGTPG
jgi:hypothetical protein